MAKEKIFEQTYFLTPAECNPEGRMPITLLINRLIEVATLHANQLGIGYDSLVERHGTWVLSRVAVEMRLYPGVNDHYTVRTWVNGINRLFSERCFEIVLTDTGETIGYSRTIWAVMNTDTRTVADISHMEWISTMIPQGKECPIAPPERPRPVQDVTHTETYRFNYCDLDFNRHVNSSRYIELLLNQWTLDFHDHNRLTRFEIAYMHEAYFDEEVEVRLSEHTEGVTVNVRAELLHDGNALCRSVLAFNPR